MSAFSKIVADVKKFFTGTGTDLEKFATAFNTLFKKSPSALQAVENFTNEAAPLIEGAVAIAAPSDETAAATALATIETSLAALQAAATSANSGQSFLQNLQNFAASVPSVLGAIQVKSPALQAKITSIVTLVVNETKVLIPAVESWIAQISSAATAAK